MIVVVLILVLSIASEYGSLAPSNTGGGSGGGGDTPISVSTSASTQSGGHPLQVTFTSTVSGGTPPYSYQWSFGDGGTATTATATHTYTVRGGYSAGLTVTDSKLTSKSASPVPINVNPVYQRNVVQDASNVNIGVGLGGALDYEFTVPTVGPAPQAINTSITGTVDVTACGLLCNNLAAYVMIVTPSAAQTILSGGSASVIWCFSVGGTYCSSEQDQAMNFDLSGYSGQVLVLLVYNDNITVGQTANINVSVYELA